ncbi:MAG: hypothetical protein J5999_08920 [Oscillospiraceae bacterium]|nr:hypothetical protein [Oscillospiraceae bacterium]
MKFKKLFSAIAAVALAAAMAVTASADVIWEPYESDFYTKYQEDAEYYYNARQFVSNVDVDIYDEPYKNVKSVLKAGTPQYVSLVVTDDDGSRWGSFGYSDGNSVFDAWICLDGMSLVYDSTEFIKDHEGEFTAYNGELADVSLEGKDIYFWKYPGSCDCTAANNFPEDIENYFDRVYTDDLGSWGYIGYMMGERDVWVYLDDPTNPVPEKLADILAQTEIVTLPPEKTVPVLEEAVTGNNSENPPTEDNTSTYLPAVILAVSAAAIAAVCLAVFGRKKKSDGE